MTPFSDGKPRRMVMNKLTAVAITQQGANPHADVTFMKSTIKQGEERRRRRRRRDDPEYMDKAAVEKRFGILNEVDSHQHVIDVIGYEGARQRGTTSFDDGHSHEWVRLEDGTIQVLTAEGHTHTVETSVPAVEKSTGFLLDEETFEEVQISLSDETEEDKMTTKADNPLESVVKNLQAVINLPAAQLAYYKTLNEPDQADFMSKTSAQREEVVKSAEDADPVLYTTTDGDEIRKSHGSTILKMAQRNDEMAKRLEDQELAKRVEQDLPGLGGDLNTKKALVKAVDCIADEDTRKSVHSLLKSCSLASKMMTSSIGHNGHLAKSDEGENEEPVESDLAKSIKASYDLK